MVPREHQICSEETEPCRHNGFDAHACDPLASLEVSTEAYAEATKIAVGIADRHAGGRLISALEGGYDLDALADSVTTHLQTLMD